MTDIKESSQRLNDAFAKLERLLENTVRPDNNELEMLQTSNLELQEKLLNQNNNIATLENKNTQALHEIEKLIDKIRKL